jgi:hypothetical protein
MNLYEAVVLSELLWYMYNVHETRELCNHRTRVLLREKELCLIINSHRVLLKEKERKLVTRIVGFRGMAFREG